MAESRSRVDLGQMGEIKWAGAKGTQFGGRNILYFDCGNGYTGIYICLFSKNIHLKQAHFIVFISQLR